MPERDLGLKKILHSPRHWVLAGVLSVGVGVISSACEPRGTSVEDPTSVSATNIAATTTEAFLCSTHPPPNDGMFTPRTLVVGFKVEPEDRDLRENDEELNAIIDDFKDILEEEGLSFIRYDLFEDLDGTLTNKPGTAPVAITAETDEPLDVVSQRLRDHEEVCFAEKDPLTPLDLD